MNEEATPGIDIVKIPVGNHISLKPESVFQFNRFQRNSKDCKRGVRAF
jgi:hypothetical protein